MYLSNRKTSGRKKRCSTKGCDGCRLEEMRFCGKCVNKTYKAMHARGYLTPQLTELKFFYDNGLRKKFT